MEPHVRRSTNIETSAAPIGDPEWRLPMYLNERLYAATNPDPRLDDPMRRALREVDNAKSLTRALDALLYKYREHRRTAALLASVEAREQDFILYLRQFPYARNIVGGKLVSQPRNEAEFHRRVDAADALQGYPIVWVSDPMYDPTFDRKYLRDAGKVDHSFRMELDQRWAEHIRELIRSASLILMDGGLESAGTSIEVQTVFDCWRQDNFIRVPGSLDGDSKPAQELLGEILRRWSRRSAIRSSLPHIAPTCPWVTGARRAELGRRRDESYAVVERYIREADPASRPDIEATLTAMRTVLFVSIALEDIEYFGRFCRWTCAFFKTVPESALGAVDQVAKWYLFMLDPAGEPEVAYPPAPVTDTNPTADSIYAAVLRYFSGFAADTEWGVGDAPLRNRVEVADALRVFHIVLGTDAIFADDPGGDPAAKLPVQAAGYLAGELDEDGLATIGNLHRAYGSASGSRNLVAQLGYAMTFAKARDSGFDAASSRNIAEVWNHFQIDPEPRQGLLWGPLRPQEIEAAIELGTSLAAGPDVRRTTRKPYPYQIGLDGTGITLMIVTLYQQIADYARNCILTGQEIDLDHVRFINEGRDDGTYLRGTFDIFARSPHKGLQLFNVRPDGTLHEIHYVERQIGEDGLHWCWGTFVYPDEHELASPYCIEIRIPRLFGAKRERFEIDLATLH